MTFLITLGHGGEFLEDSVVSPLPFLLDDDEQSEVMHDPCVDGYSCDIK